MENIHIVASLFFILFVIFSLYGQFFAWTKSRSIDNETCIINESQGSKSNPYLFLATLFLIVTCLIEVVFMVWHVIQLAGGI